MIEIIEARDVYSKTFQLDDGRIRRVINSGVPYHYLTKEGSLEDIVLQPALKDGFMTVDRAPYVLKIEGNAYYYSGRGGEVSVELLNTDLTETEYKITPLPFGVRTDLILASEKAPRRWQWRIIGNAKMLKPVRGKDAAGKHCQITQSIEGDVLTAEWSGMVTSKRTLRRSGMKPWSDGVTYPVTIDPTVNETIGTNNDDAHSLHITGGASTDPLYLTNTYLHCGHYTATILGGLNTISYTGFLFQTVNVPQGATINSATLSLTINAGSVVGSPSIRWYADDVDSAAAWASGSRIKNITKTTAFTAFAPTTAGLKSIDVTAIVQELVNRAGWVANNNMRFGGFDQTGAGQNEIFIEALEAAGTAQATLDIDYTAVGGGGVPWYKRMKGFTGGFDRSMTGGFDA